MAASASQGGHGSLIKVTDGAFTTTSFAIGRTSAPALGGNAPATSGFVATGGTASMTSLTVGNSNSSATARIDGCTVTVTDTINLGNGTSNSRWNTLQVNSGSLTVSGTAGIQLSTNTTVANLSQLRLTGGTTTTEAINFGAAASLADSRGEVEIGSGATLYVGSEGVDIVSANAYTANFKANGGTIGAKAAWTSTVPVALAASSTFKAADTDEAPFDISLNAGISGAGGLIKTGGGTLTLGVVAPDYSGDTTISSGTLTGLTLTFAKRQPLAGDITYSIEESTDLGISDVWAPVTLAVNDDTTISYTLPGVPAKDFLRLKVVRN